MEKISMKINLLGLLLFNLLLGVICLMLIVASMIDFPYKAGYYSDYVVGHLLTFIIFSVVWNFWHFIRLVMKRKRDDPDS